MSWRVSSESTPTTNLAASVDVYQSFREWFSRTRANENQIWFAMTSIVGRQKDLVFSGDSRVVSPTGDVVARAKDNREDLVVYDIDLHEVYRARALSHVLDRRVPRAYRLITAEEET